MNITKAVLIGKDAHFRCECMVEGETDEVYGTDSKFTPRDAARAFKNRHDVNHAAPPAEAPIASVNVVAPIAKPPTPDWEVRQRSVNVDPNDTSLIIVVYTLLRNGKGAGSFTVAGRTKLEIEQFKAEGEARVKAKVAEVEKAKALLSV